MADPKERTRRRREITAAILIDEERIALRARAEERLAELEQVSPPCTNTWKQRGKERSCSHKLNVHEPCSKCGCRTFKGADGLDAELTSMVLIDKHPDLFPQPKPERPN